MLWSVSLKSEKFLNEFDSRGIFCFSRWHFQIIAWTCLEMHPIVSLIGHFFQNFAPSLTYHQALLLAWWPPLLSDLHSSKETEVVLCTKTLLHCLALEHELRMIHLQVLPEELHLLICYLLLYFPKSLTPDVAMTPQTCRTQLSRRLLKLEDWPTLCWNQVESQSPQPHALESNLAKTLEWMTLRKQIVNKQGKRSLNKTNKVYKWPI